MTSTRWPEQTSHVTRLLIVDDHAGFRSVARALLQGEGFEVVAEAADGPQAVAEAVRCQPDVVLLDVHLPGPDGFAVSQELAALPRPPKVVLTSSRPISDLRGRLSRSPAIGFLSKDELAPTALVGLVGP